MSINVGIIGYGNLGKALEQVILSKNNCRLVAIFSRRLVKSQFNTLIESYENISLYKNKIDLMFLCGGSSSDVDEQTRNTLLNFDCINSFDTHKKIASELEILDKIAKNSNHRLIMSCGWDPGLFSNIRATLLSLAGKKPDVFWGKGISMGHSEVIRKINNVQDAVQFTIPNKEAIKLAKQSRLIGDESLHFRECFVVADKNHHKKIERQIKNIPNYFKDQQTRVNFVTREKLLTLRNKLTHQGQVISKFNTIHGTNCYFYLKLKMDSNPNLTATILASYINAIINLKEKKISGAFTPLDIPTIYHFKPSSRMKIIKNIC